MDDRFDKLLREDQTPADRLALARALLQPAPDRDPTWPALAAAGFLAASALVFAAGAFFAPQLSAAPQAAAGR